MNGQRTLPLILCTGLLIMVLFLMATSIRAQSSVLYVAPAGDCGGASPCYSMIQPAVDAANDGDTVKVAQGTYTSPGFQVLYINKTITVRGGYTIADWSNSMPETRRTVLDAENVPRRRGVFIDGSNAATIAVDGLTVQRGNAVNGADGGGIYILTGTVWVQNSHVLTCTASNNGGGIYIENGVGTLANNTIQGNIAGSGGGVYGKGTVVLRNSVIWDNSANQGGGLSAEGDCEVASSFFQGNKAGWGAGMFLSGIATVTDSIIRYNSGAGGAGVAVYGVATLSNNTIQGNTGLNAGGGVWVHAGATRLISNTIEHNTALRGGGVAVEGEHGNYVGTVVLLGNSITGNSATGDSTNIDLDGGGGVYVRKSDVIMSNNTVQDNSATYHGGGIAILGGSMDDYFYTTELTDNVIQRNVTKKNGGGIYVSVTLGDLSRNTVLSNTAQMQGGGMYVVGMFVSSHFSMDTNVIVSNTANTYGGGIALGGGKVRGQNDIIASNTSLAEGVYLASGTLSATHWTILGNGDYGLASNAGTAVLTNTIVASHTLAGLWGIGITADHTLFNNTGISCGGGASCQNSLSADPVFVNPAVGNYHIGRDSPAIDAGVLAGVLRDIDNEPRMGIPDLGADEYWAPGALKIVYLPLVLRSTR